MADEKEKEELSNENPEDKEVNTPPSDEKAKDEQTPESKDTPSDDEGEDKPQEGDDKNTNGNEAGKTPSEDVDYAAKDTKEVSDALKDFGFNYDTLVQEYVTNGDITAKTRAELAKVGISQQIVDSYITGMKAKAEQDYNEISEEVGGRENFNKIINWAAHNLDAEEIKSINAVTDKYQVKSILRDLKVRMEEKEGKSPNYVNGSGKAASEDIYRSQAEMFEAINNPKYKKDEAYRSDVQKKITASREAGVDLGI